VSTLSDPGKLKLIRGALSEWRYTNSVIFKPTAWSWIRKELSGNHTKKGVAKLLWEHVENGGKIDEQIERRKLEVDDNLIRDYHYDVNLSIESRLVYFELILIDDDLEDPVIWVVSVHDA
jgi:hypothetical protein